MSGGARIVLASGNAGKLREFGALLAPTALEVHPQSAFGVDSAEETGVTFIENALLKARHASRATGLPALADDSGLEVAALGGAPGVYSARYAGAEASDADNVDKLLAALADEPDRRAAFSLCDRRPAPPGRSDTAGRRGALDRPDRHGAEWQRRVRL